MSYRDGIYRDGILSVRLPGGAVLEVITSLTFHGATVNGVASPEALTTYWLRHLPPCTLSQARRLLANRRAAGLPVEVILRQDGMADVAVCLTPGEATAVADGEDWRPLTGLRYPLQVVPKDGEEGWLDGC